MISLGNYRILFGPEGEGDGGSSGEGTGAGEGGEGAGGQTGPLLKGDESGTGGGTGDGGTPPPPTMDNWRESLPEDLKGHEALSKHDSFEGLVRGFVNAQRVIGKDPNSLIELPATDAGFDGKREALQKLGAPKEADGYKIEAGEGTPDYLKPEGQMAQGFTKKASELGLLPEQVQGIYSWFSETMGQTTQQTQEQSQQQIAENIQSLESEWGEAFDQKVAAADFAVEKLGGKELRDEINASNLATSPRVLKALAAAGEMMREDGAGDESGRGTGFGERMTPAEAKSRADEMTRRASQLEFNNPERKRLNEEAAKIRAKARGEKIDF